jgi:hypothetical protein
MVTTCPIDLSFAKAQEVSSNQKRREWTAVLDYVSELARPCRHQMGRRVQVERIEEDMVTTAMVSFLVSLHNIVNVSIPTWSD